MADYAMINFADLYTLHEGAYNNIIAGDYTRSLFANIYMYVDTMVSYDCHNNSTATQAAAAQLNNYYFRQLCE